jgi:peptidoglycan/LPS O-acetylase OafA/YrhL
MHRAAVLASLIAAIAVTSRPASADDVFLFARHPKVDQRVATVSIGTGIAATAAYFAIREGHHHHNVDWNAWGITTVGCMVLGPMIAAAFVPERQLTSREVLVMEGSCIVPIVGGLLVNALFDANPQWEAPARPVRVARKRHARR